MAAELVAAAEAPLATVDGATVGPILDWRLRGSVWILSGLYVNNFVQIAPILLDYLQPLACGRTIGGQLGVTLVLFL